MMEETDKKVDAVMWKMRNNVIQEDDSNEWKNRRSTPLADMQNFARRVTRGGLHASMDAEEITKIMASLVPDEIIYNIGDYSKREFDGCLLFGDVSGFTDLCEKYNKSGKGGPSRLTQVLNDYIGAMVQEILSHSGDVLEFSGDAFIALWKVTDHLSMRDAVHEAIDCSLVIQKSYGTYRTDVGVIVRVKLAVASGHLVFSLVGDDENSHYLMNGKPIYDLKEAESRSSAGEIVITARVSHHISANEYLMDILPDGLHAKVLGVGPNWRNIQRQYDTKDTYSIGSENYNEEDLLSHTTRHSKTSMSIVGKDNMEDEVAGRVYTDQYALRPAVNFAARQNMKHELRRFIIAPVVRGIDAEEPLEYLTEIRQVAILLINCKIPTSMNPSDGIDLANNVYITVCNAVKNRFGCVNKINNFDKDLMVLVIFGLRGFKDEMESQIALKCAKEVNEKIKSLKNIQGVACGVTTGKCYCGAFGHTLRREYTVIGLVVNKAARFMMAYPDRVTCDRETFLHSKLEARNFVLEEPKHLKGIVNPGPIYKFKEVERIYDIGGAISNLPLLGRDQEMGLYISLCKTAKQRSKTKSDRNEKIANMLVIEGDYRQGKSRLLEEMLYVTDPNTPVNTLPLTKADRVSYRTIQLIFRYFIGLPSNTTQEAREEKLRIRYKNKISKQYFMYLNEIFEVNFQGVVSDNLETKLDKIQKLFIILCNECFVKFWIIAIDEAEYVDDESWMLIQVLLDLNKVFIVASLSTQRELTAYAIEALKHEKIKVISLKPIDKWYHVGLACQMLGIEGIPPELEKAIQLRSNGNPGWIESFLVTVLQSGGLYIEKIKKINAYNKGLVLAPLYMLMRMSPEEIDIWMDIMEERTFPNEDASKRWKLFFESCRESYQDVTVMKKFEEELKHNKLISICLMNPKFNLDDVEPGYYIDVVILKIFDSLTSYEQLLLKCSSILGDIFPRDLLLYIMSSSAIRITALAVKKLFEIQVLSCAKGNFLEGGLNFKYRLLNPNEDMSVKCDCLGLIIDETCTDLPKYASCGYLRFRSSEFRETTYNLLTDNQKREFHERAIRYLEKETRRCRACGNGYFTRRIGGCRIDEGLKTHKPLKVRRSSLSQISVDTDVESRSFSRMGRTISHTSYGSTVSAKSKDWFKHRETLYSLSLVSYTDASLDSGGENFNSSMERFGYNIIKKLKDNFNLARTFSNTDYSQCTCLLVLNTMYSQMIQHCKGAGLVEKVMNTTIEYCYVCFENRNAPQAIKVLEEALQLLDGPMKDQIELEWMVALKRGKLFALLGYARMLLQDDEAYVYLTSALKCYGTRFPEGDIRRKLVKTRHKLQQNMKLYLCPWIFSHSGDTDVAEYCNNVSECLSFLCKYFMLKDMWQQAELAAIWSLNQALRTETDFEKMCIAYGNMIVVAGFTRQKKLCVALEVYSLKMCHRKKSNVEIDELKAVTYLYYCICRSRCLKDPVDKAMHMSYLIWRIATASQTHALLLSILPLLTHITLMKKQIPEVVHVLQEVLYLSDLDVDGSETTWYYALCLMLHLETGLTAQPISKCYKYILGQGLDEAVLRDNVCKQRLIVLIWLWEIRNENWEGALCWERLAWQLKLKDFAESYQNLFTGLYLLEGLLIYMVNKLDMKNLKALAKAEAKIANLFDKITKEAKYCIGLSARLHHMKAYYMVAKYSNLKSALKLLKKALKAAERHNNELEKAWILHSEQAWCNRMSREEMFAWRNHCEEENLIHFQDMDAEDNIVYYTLPLPLYL